MERSDRLAAWLFVPVLALAATLLFMVGMPSGGDEQPIQSLRIFSNLRLFAALYSLWLLLLFILLWRTPGLWWGAVLVSLFAIVHVGTVVLATRHGAGEDWLNAADAVQIQQSGRLDLLVYRDFPGLFIFWGSLATVFDVDVFALRTPLLLAWLATLSTLLFVGYSRIFKSFPLAAFAVLVAIQSNIVLARFYLHPSTMGVLLLVSLLGFLLGREQPLGARERLLLILMMVALAMTHFVSSMIGLLVIAGYYLERRWHRRLEVVSRDMVTLCLTLVLAWSLYWTITTFPSVVTFLPQVDDRLREGIAFFHVNRVAAANVAPLPFWVTAVQTFWWLMVYIAGGFLALGRLLPQQKFLTVAPGYAGAYVVLAGGGVVGTIVSPGGYDFYRMILYGSFLAAPLAVHALLARRGAKILTLAVAAAFLALSFPTLLAHNASIAQQAHTPSEIARAQFLSRALDGSEDLPSIFAEDHKYRYFLPAIVPQIVPFHTDPAAVSPEEFRSRWASYVDDFVGQGAEGEEAVFSSSYGWRLVVRHLVGLPTDDPLWDEMNQSLSQADRFYDAGPVQLYRASP